MFRTPVQMHPAGYAGQKMNRPLQQVFVQQVFDGRFDVKKP